MFNILYYPKENLSLLIVNDEIIILKEAKFT